MDFDYTADQRHLRDEARRFLSAACPPAAVRRVLDDKSLTHDADLWRRIAEQGWLGAAIPEAYGGLGLSHVELGAITEEIGAVLAPIPFGSTLYWLAEAVLIAGSAAQKQALLPKIAAGEVIGCGAIYEGAGDLDPRTVRAEVRGGRLTGRKSPVVDGLIADTAVVLAREGGDLALFLVDLGDAAVTRVALEAVDGSMNVAALVFDGAVADRLAGSNERVWRSLLSRAAVMTGFEQVGGADRCLQRTTDYVKDRQAFGGPVGRFQAVKHKLADIYVANELARSHVYHGVWAMDGAEDKLMAAAAAARVAASDAYWLASKEAVHLHGGVGFTWEADMHLFYRRAHHLSLAVGSPQWWRDHLFEALSEAVPA